MSGASVVISHAKRRRAFARACGGLLAAVVFGGSAGVAAAQSWSLQSPTGGPPSVRMLAGHAYDAAGDNLIITHGATPTGYSNETWVLEDATSGTPAWTQLATSGGPPQARGFHSSVYAPSSNRLIIYGGCLANCGFAASDVWTLTNANGTGGTPTWSPLATSGADNREGHLAVYDDANNRMIVFGGQHGFNSYPSNPQVRVLTNADGTDAGTPTWSTLVPDNAGPSDREGVGLAYDAASSRLIVFGGYQLTCCAAVVDVFNDTWVLENANGLGGTPHWTQLAPTGGPPADRVFPSAVYDAPGNRLIVFGGATGFTSTSFDDTWVLEHANGLGGTPMWTQLSPSGGPPEARHGHSAAYAAGSSSMVITMGRHDEPAFHMLNDTWVLRLRDGAFSCRATGLRLATSEAAVANPPGSPCRDDAQTLIPARLGTAVWADVVNASTSQTPDHPANTPPAVGDASAAHADAANVVLVSGANILRIGLLEADARAECTASSGRTPALSAGGRIATLSVNGRPIIVGSGRADIPLALATLRLNQTIAEPNRITRRALVLDNLLLPDIVVAEAVADFEGTPCPRPRP